MHVDAKPMVWLVPADPQTASVAGQEFARALSGAESVLFLLALGEQTELIRTGIRRAGYPRRQAHLAASAFEAAASKEWQRISTAQPATWGNA
jgi:hypothetical protein